MTVFINKFDIKQAMRNIKFKESQYDYYKKNTDDPDILSIVSMESKRFGSVSEQIIRGKLVISSTTDTTNDGCKNNKLFEIKSARYWAGTNDCKWQHLEFDYEYDFAIFGLLDFEGYKVYLISKKDLDKCRNINRKNTNRISLRRKKIVTHQGKQGWWCQKNHIIDYLTEITSVEQFDEIINN